MTESHPGSKTINYCFTSRRNVPRWKVSGSFEEKFLHASVVIGIIGDDNNDRPPSAQLQCPIVYSPHCRCSLRRLLDHRYVMLGGKRHRRNSSLAYNNEDNE